MHRVLHTVRSIARHELAQHWSSALGLVTSVHGASGGPGDYHACTVELRETGLVLPKVPIAVGLIGQASLPREGDLVVVLFAGGDLHAPVVVGRLYDEEVAPPQHGPGETVIWLPGDETDATKALELRVKTPGDGTRQLALVLDGSVRVEVVVKDDGILLKAQDAQLSLTQTGSSDGKAEIQVGEAKVTLEQSGDITFDCSGTLKLKAGKIEIAGDAEVKVSGQTIDLN